MHIHTLTTLPLICLPIAGAYTLDVQCKAGSFDLSVAPAGVALSTPPSPDDVGLFLHTSGTTSRPKGVPLTQANLVASLENIVDVSGCSFFVRLAARCLPCCSVDGLASALRPW